MGWSVLLALPLHHDEPADPTLLEWAKGLLDHLFGGGPWLMVAVLESSSWPCRWEWWCSTGLSTGRPAAVSGVSRRKTRVDPGLRVSWIPAGGIPNG